MVRKVTSLEHLVWKFHNIIFRTHSNGDDDNDGDDDGDALSSHRILSSVDSKCTTTTN